MAYRPKYKQYTLQDKFPIYLGRASLEDAVATYTGKGGLELPFREGWQAAKVSGQVSKAYAKSTLAHHSFCEGFLAHDRYASI